MISERLKNTNVPDFLREDIFDKDQWSVRRFGNDRNNHDDLPILDEFRYEHKCILRIMDRLGDYCRMLIKKEAMPANGLASVLKFLRIFSDIHHHYKEEDLIYPLFPVGRAGEKKIIDLLMREHDNERMYLNIIEQSLRDYEEGKQNAAIWLAVHIGKYVQLRVEHIHKENRILFPIIESNLSRDIRYNIAKVLAHFEKISPSAVWDEEFQALMRELEEEYHGSELAGKSFMERRAWA